MTENRTNQFTDEQIEAGAKAYWLASEREIHDKPITWEWDKEERRRYMWAARQVLAGVAPQAQNAGESTAGLRSRGDIEGKPAVQPSSTVDEARAWDEGYAEGWNERESNELQPTNPYRAALGLTAGQEGKNDEG